MIIFLRGLDSYRRRQKEKELTDFYQRKHPDFDFKKFDLSEDQDDYLALKDFLGQQSLFSNFKMSLIRGILEVEAKKIKPILKEQLTNENAVLVVSEDKSTKDFDFLLQKPVHCQEFKKLNAEELAFFIRKEAEKSNSFVDLSSDTTNT